jgi:hypothetical protein
MIPTSEREMALAGFVLRGIKPYNCIFRALKQSQCGLPVRGVRISNAVCKSSRRRFGFGGGACSVKGSPRAILRTFSAVGDNAVCADQENR